MQTIQCVDATTSEARSRHPHPDTGWPLTPTLASRPNSSSCWGMLSTAPSSASSAARSAAAAAAGSAPPLDSTPTAADTAACTEAGRVAMLPTDQTRPCMRASKRPIPVHRARRSLRTLNCASAVDAGATATAARRDGRSGTVTCAAASSSASSAAAAEAAAAALSWEAASSRSSSTSTMGALSCAAHRQHSS